MSEQRFLSKVIIDECKIVKNEGNAGLLSILLGKSPKGLQ
jgi:hypothetical protein